MRPVSRWFSGSSAALAILLCAPPTQAAEVATTRVDVARTTGTTPVAVTADALRQSTLDVALAKTWNISVEELHRARELMQPGTARAAFSVPNISPVEVLGIHARTAAERQKYAELFARAVHADVERSLMWNATFSVVYARLYPNEPVVDFKGKQLPRNMIAP